MTDYFIYYNCVRKNYYHPEFVCTPYDDPLKIPITGRLFNSSNKPVECFESIIFPIHSWVPSCFHKRLLSYELRKRVSVSFPPAQED